MVAVLSDFNSSSESLYLLNSLVSVNDVTSKFLNILTFALTAAFLTVSIWVCKSIPRLLHLSSIYLINLNAFVESALFISSDGNKFPIPFTKFAKSDCLLTPLAIT